MLQKLGFLPAAKLLTVASMKLFWKHNQALLPAVTTSSFNKAAFVTRLVPFCDAVATAADIPWCASEKPCAVAPAPDTRVACAVLVATKLGAEAAAAAAAAAAVRHLQPDAAEDALEDAPVSPCRYDTDEDELEDAFVPPWPYEV